MRTAILVNWLFVVGCQADVTSTCPLPADLDAVHAVIPDARYMSAQDAEEPDMLVLQLRGSFPESGVVVELGGPEADYATCTACVLVYPRWNEERGPSQDPYIATSGVLRFTTLSRDFVAGTLHDVMLAPADFGIAADTTPPADCTATLAHLELAAVPDVEHDCPGLPRGFRTLRLAGR